jgi:hypothetical protein
MMDKASYLILVVALATSTSTAIPGSANDQPIPIITSCNDITESMGYKIRSVRIRGRWVPHELIQKVNAIIPVNSDYNPITVESAINLVGDELNSSAIDTRKLRYAIASIYAQVCRVPGVADAKYADITIIPYYIQVDLTSPGRNILPIPRIDTPNFSVGVPRMISALSPQVSGSSDSNYGPSLQLQTRTNLLRPFDGDAITNKYQAPVNLDLAYRKSFDNTNYNLDTAISYLNPDPLQKTTPYIALLYTNSVKPLGRSSNWSEDGLLDMGLYQGQTTGLLRTYALGVKSRVVSNAIDNASELQTQNSSSEQAVQAYLVSDLRISRGVGRIGLWGDFGYPSDSDPYQRAAIQAGYATEVGRGHNTLGIQLLSSASYIWGNPPQYNRFFGGTQATNFLYDPFLDNSIRNFPTGPLLRSYGETQAGLSQSNGLTLGATSYWGLSLTTYIPISGWSRPLIPNIQVSSNKNLGQVIKNQVKTSKRYVIGNLMQAGYSREAAEAESSRLLDQGIIPAVTHIVDHVNIFSIRPFFAVDIAQLGSSISTEGFTRTTYIGVGGGAQASLVGTSLEMGYMQSVAPSSSISEGNFFLRFVLKDLF